MADSRLIPGSVAALCLVLITGCGGDAGGDAPGPSAPQALLDPAARDALRAINNLLGGGSSQEGLPGRAKATPVGVSAPRLAVGDIPPGAGGGRPDCPYGGSVDSSDAGTVVTERYTNCVSDGGIFFGASVRRTTNGTQITIYANGKNRPPTQFRTEAFSVIERDGGTVLYRATSTGATDVTIVPHPTIIRADTGQPADQSASFTSTGVDTGFHVRDRLDPDDDMEFSRKSERFVSGTKYGGFDARGVPHEFRSIHDGYEEYTDHRHPERSYSGTWKLTFVTKGNLNAGDPEATTTISGAFTPSCLGSAVTVATVTPIEHGSGGSVCPTAGRLTLKLPSGSATVTYTKQREMEIDLGSDGTIDVRRSSCLELLGVLC